MKKFFAIGLILFFSQQTISQEKNSLDTKSASIKSFWNEKIDATQAAGFIVSTHGLANIFKHPIKGSLACGLGIAIVYNSQKIKEFLDKQKPEIEKYLSSMLLNSKEESKQEESKEKNSKVTK